MHWGRLLPDLLSVGITQPAGATARNAAQVYKAVRHGVTEVAVKMVKCVVRTGPSTVCGWQDLLYLVHLADGAVSCTATKWRPTNRSLLR